jgi:hypothetical protein
VIRRGPEYPVVILRAAELRRAVRHGREVQAAVEAQGQRDRFVPQRSDLQQRIEAYCAELAVAVFLGLPWNVEVLSLAELRAGKRPDVGDDIEVRTAAGRYVPVRDGDPPGRRIVGVGGRQPAYLILGWVRAGAAMRPELRHDDGRGSPYWRVPVAELAPLMRERAPRMSGSPLPQAAGAIRPARASRELEPFAG